MYKTRSSQKFYFDGDYDYSTHNKDDPSGVC